MKSKDIHRIIEDVVHKTVQKLKNEINTVSDVINLDEIPFSQLQCINIDLRDMLYGFRFDNGVTYDGDKLIISENNENKTEEPNKVKNELMGKFIFFEWQFVVRNTENGVKLILIYADEGVNGELLCEKMKYFGWAKSYELKPKIKNGIIVKAMSFDPIYQDSIDNVKDKWKVLYHLSPKYNEDSIMKNGLMPLTNNKFFKYPPRVYMLIPNIPMNEMDKLLNNLNKFERGKNNDGIFNLYRIETKRIPNDIDLFYDPRFKYGVYSTKPIPRDAITGIKDVKADD